MKRPQSKVARAFLWASARLDEVRSPLRLVTRGLDLRVNLLRITMDCRIKPGNDIG
jgi:hypothetical protein